VKTPASASPFMTLSVHYLPVCLSVCLSVFMTRDEWILIFCQIPGSDIRNLKSGLIHI